MVPHLPRWAWIWAAVLPFLAGSVNVVGILSVAHSAVTHLTGVSSQGAIAWVHGDASALQQCAMLVACFVLGCAVSAFVCRGPRWTPRLAYAGVFLGEACLLAIAASAVDRAPQVSSLLCAAAIGLQNGASSLVTGAILRTSHLTGMFTDLGIAIGQRLRKAQVDGRRVRVCLLVIGAFIGGGSAGAWLFGFSAGHALWMPAILAMALAASQLAWDRRRSGPGHHLADVS